MQMQLAPIGGLTVTFIASVVVASFAGGWVFSRKFPEAPAGVEPEFWRAVCRRKRRQFLNRFRRQRA